MAKGREKFAKVLRQAVEWSHSPDPLHQQAGEEKAVCAVQSRTRNATSGESSKGAVVAKRSEELRGRFESGVVSETLGSHGEFGGCGVGVGCVGASDEVSLVFCGVHSVQLCGQVRARGLAKEFLCGRDGCVAVVLFVRARS